MTINLIFISIDFYPFLDQSKVRDLVGNILIPCFVNSLNKSDTDFDEIYFIIRYKRVNMKYSYKKKTGKTSPSSVGIFLFKSLYLV